jgi:hypothetical protein
MAMRLDEQNVELVGFLNGLGIGDELESIYAYMLGNRISAPSLDIVALSSQVSALLTEAHPDIGESLRNPRFPELLRVLLNTAEKNIDEKIAPDFGIDVETAKSSTQIVDAATGLSACLYCFLRGVKEGMRTKLALIDNFTLMQLEQLEGAWDLLRHLVQRVKEHPHEREYRIELKSATRSCFSVWKAAFPGFRQFRY